MLSPIYFLKLGVPIAVTLNFDLLTLKSKLIVGLVSGNLEWKEMKFIPHQCSRLRDHFSSKMC